MLLIRHKSHASLNERTHRTPENCLPRSTASQSTTTGEFDRSTNFFRCWGGRRIEPFIYRNAPANSLILTIGIPGRGRPFSLDKCYPLTTSKAKAKLWGQNGGGISERSNEQKTFTKSSSSKATGYFPLLLVFK